jgi:hypothetical protein
MRYKDGGHDELRKKIAWFIAFLEPNRTNIQKSFSADIITDIACAFGAVVFDRCCGGELRVNRARIRMRLNAILHAFTPWDDLSAVRFIIWNAANNASCEETTRAFLWFTAIQRVKRK